MDLESIIERAVTGLGYGFVDLESSPRARLLRVFIDVPAERAGQGGITVEDCAAVSNHLTRLFMVENIDYDRLEVSSPGLDRPLKRLTDFERFVGNEASVRLRIAVGSQRNFIGVIEAVEGGEIVLRMGATAHRFDFSQIEKARLVPNFDGSGKTEVRR